MDLDDLFAPELRELGAETERRERHLREALRRLQVAGQSAYDALRKAGHTSGKIGRGIGRSSGTVRKLNADGEKTPWQPSSRETYAELDQYTLRWLGRSWDLAGLRDAVATARGELKAARQRLTETSARADHAVPAFDLGVLYLPGLPERRVDRSLRQLGDALAGSFVKDRHGGGAGVPVEVVQARLTADGDEPARLVLQRGRPDGDGGGGAEEHRWLVAASPAGQLPVD